MVHQHSYKQPSTDKWSIHENVAHLGRYQEIFDERLHEILVQSKPRFNRYVSVLDESFFRWKAYPKSIVLSKLKSRRIMLIDRLSHLTDDQLQRTGQHPKFGSMSIIDWTEFFLLHETHHIYTIFRLTNSFKHELQLLV